MLVLRDFNQEDIESLVLLLNNKKVTQFLTSQIPQPYEIKDSVEWVNRGSKKGITKAIEENGQLIGTIGVTPGEYENHRSGEIGYWFGEKFWGRGLATKALLEMTHHIFSQTEIIRLYAPVFSPNRASIRVLEKCGYQLEGVLKKAIYKNDQFFDEHLYAKIHSSINPSQEKTCE